MNGTRNELVKSQWKGSNATGKFTSNSTHINNCLWPGLFVYLIALYLNIIIIKLTTKYYIEKEKARCKVLENH